MKGITIQSFFRLSALVCTLVVANSCELQTEVYDNLSAKNFPASEQELLSTVGNAYRGLLGYYDNERYFALVDASTDELVAPTRGRDWFDNGRWKQLAEHDWNAQAPGFMNATWEWCYGAIAQTNLVLVNLKESKTAISGKETIVAEMKTLRAFYYFLLCDTFGNVPIITEDSPSGAVKQSTRQEVFTFVESEVKASLPNLRATKYPDTYSRVTKEVANTLLAKLYLNAQVYTGTARWQDAIGACDAVISTNFHSLSGDFFSNFAVNNRSNGSHKENIFVIPYDKNDYKGGDFDLAMRVQLTTLHPKLTQKYGLGESPWNGFCTIADFYNSYDAQDVRKQGWLAGPQKDRDGNVIKYFDGVDQKDQELDFKPFFSDLSKTNERDGARFSKIQIQENNPNRLQDNHFPIFRYADVLLMKGEAALRLGQTATALQAINQVRTRAKMAAYTSITLDEVLNERGREFAWECWRRNDLVRFDRFGNGTWQFKKKKEAKRDLFPIPSQQLANNPTLKQNPGY